MSRHIVFVYGSLKSGFHNHRLLIDYKATPLGVAATDERYLLLKGAAFPFLINPLDLSDLRQDAFAGVRGYVAGELYRVDDACLAALDRLESHPRFYRRELISLNHGVKAWAYFLTRPDERLCDEEGLGSNSFAEPDASELVEWKRADVFADAEDSDAQ